MDEVTAEHPEGNERATADRPAADHSGADEPATTDHGEADDVVSAELVPLDDVAKALLMGLRPIPDQVVGERRELAEALRRCFFELDTTMRRYAVLRRYSASSLSRYLSGETAAPDHFVNALMDDVGKKLGRPMSPQARQAMTRMQRAALKSTNSRAWQVQQLEDQLAGALQEKALARTMADAVATSLLEHQERVATLEAERRALTEEVAARRTTGIELDLLRAEQHRMLTDHQALRRRVAELEAALEAAELRVALAEQRCADLEHTLLAADASAAAEEDADRLRMEEKLARRQEELDRLREEVASLRVDRVAEARPGEHDAPRPRPESATGPPSLPETQARSAYTDVASHVTVVFAGYHRPWAAWIARRLESHGHRATLQRWDPPRDVPLEQTFRDLLLPRGHVLLVLDEWFFELGARPDGEWNDLLRGFAVEHTDRFAAVSLTDRTLLPAAAALEPVSLWGVDEEEAGARLLARLTLRTVRPAARRVPPGSPIRYPADPPAVWGEVPRRNPRFTGRDDLLTALRERLTDAERGTAAFALVGMSGIGKTQIAAEYAHRFSPDYDVVWWVNSADRTVRRDALGELAVGLSLPVGREPGERVRAVREALRRGDPHGRWLVVFDGWEDTDDIDVMLPQGPGHVLITSRNRGWREHTDILEVPGFDRRESTGHLMRRAPQISAAEADEVAAEVGDVPLPVVQAAAWLGETGEEAAAYLRRLRDGRVSTIEDSLSGDSLPHDSLASWSLLINRLRRSHPQALQVLSLCAALAPGPKPLGLLRSGPAAHLPVDVRWIATDQAAWNRALDTLTSYSILTRIPRPAIAGKESGPDQESVHMHRLVHDIVTRLIDREHHDAHRKAVRNLLAEADPGDPTDSGQWHRYSTILPHLEASGALRSTAPRIQSTVLNCLRFCASSGVYGEGIRLARRIRQHWDDFMDPAGVPMHSLTAVEADLLRAAGRFREAYEQSVRALRKPKDLDPHGELAELTTQSAVANGMRHLGRYEDAHRFQREILDRSIRLVGTDDPRSLAARHDLAATLRALGRYREAYENDLLTRAQREELLGRDHLAGLASANAVTRDQRLLGMHAGALAHQTAVVRRHAEAFGLRHPQTLEADVELALCRRHGDPQGMDTSLAELLDRSGEIHGPGHHITLQCLTLYAHFLRKHGDLEQARKLSAEAETGYRALLGPAHPVSAGAVTTTALVMRAAGEQAAALTMLESTLAGLESSVGPDHPWTLGCALNTAAARHDKGEVAAAAELSRDTLRRAQQTLGPEHPLALSCQLALAADLRALPGLFGLRESEEAEKLEEDAVHRLTGALGSRHPLTLSARSGIRPAWEFEPYVD
ncbi:FxSxx-COOH system tetratricopeptide repeat protein [Streptomyces flavochromogenes]|uniref:FxSxx-COOH system tetratricopeptide repeat protein n=1 Tax=Streptomyces flavochromogenes TaxID=68199 RepID=UPI000A8B3B9F|nr:FxSxx-COOH system tetratricopeptide repeat protein [Streptomyces flavochromogenes]